MSSSSSSDNNQNVTSEAAAEQAAPDLTLRRVADAAPLLLSYIDREQRYRYNNRTYETWFKRPRREIIGKTLAEALGESAYESIRPHIETVLSGQSVTFQSIVTHGDGTIRLVETSYAPDFDERGDVRGFVAAVTDITGRDAAAIDQTNLLAARQEAADAQQRKFLRDVLYSVTEGKLRLCDGPGDLPRRLAPRTEPIALHAESLHLLRRQISDAADSCGLDADRSYDMVSATGEAAMNAIVHAGGGTAAVGAGPDGLVQVWIEDQGQGIDLSDLPQATLERGFTTAGTMGHGFYIILKTVDRIYLLTGPQGTTVVLEQERTAPEPDWLSYILNAEAKISLA